LLGAEQHGHIAAVGFDTYARLLREAVADLRGEPIPTEREVKIDLPLKAYIPVGWVGQEALRLELYRFIATAGDHQRLEEVRAEAVDRYGRLPQEVETLLAVASLRIACLELGVQEIATYRDQVRLKPVALADADALALAERVPGATFHTATSTLNLSPAGEHGAELARWIERALRAATGVREPASVTG
jgi:transcription-repair coupling factor (superfamily II helicase)